MDRRRALMAASLNKKEDIYSERYLTMEALEDKLSVTFDAECEYCVDGDGDWKVLPAYGFVYINKGQFLCFRGNLIPSDYGIGTFETFEKFNLKGNAMSMLFGDYGKENSSLAGYDYAFSYLFSSCRKLQSVSPDFLPATTLSKGCYLGMFYGCDSLKDAPNLPATTLVEECYKYMFRECSKLASQITLPAEHLKPYCYTGMFYNCRLLDYIKALFVDVPSSDYTEGWVFNVSPSGTFVKNPNATWDVIGDDGVPHGWTVVYDGEEDESPYAFSFNIEVAKGQSWTANAEQLVHINKMFAIITKFLGMKGGDFSQDNAPQEFDLRINGVRSFNFWLESVSNESDVLDVYYSFTDGDGMWFGQMSFPWNNPVVNAFILTTI